MSKKLDWREASRSAWATSGLTESKDLDPKYLQLGCMMRIADALELLVTDIDRVKKDIKFYQDLAEQLKMALNDAENVLKVERGHKTRLKKKVTELTQRITELELEKESN